ncbi:hypothetical protein [Haloglycomyces albus]|uniref:hypothetical protein n=1 Tax=Haloglycomyces albus TaxID=526067 RepID=UPI00046D45C6|nr:hypothetical protein [Haloglycomyces albus]
MGKYVREVEEGVTKYYWYPGEKTDWLKAVIALATGVGIFVAVLVVFDSTLMAATFSSSGVLGLAGFYLGRKDASGLDTFHDPTAERRAAIADGTRAAWRGTLQGLVSAGSAIFVLNMPHTGFLADWILPLVPSTMGALAHSGGMLWQRMANDVAAEATSGDVESGATENEAPQESESQEEKAAG